jgi:Ca2+/Na+ antiporter
MIQSATDYIRARRLSETYQDGESVDYDTMMANKPICNPGGIAEFDPCDGGAYDSASAGFELTYLEEGETFDFYERWDNAQGFVEEYYNAEWPPLCHSYLIIIPGTSLLNVHLLRVVYLIFLFWLFLGIQIIADIFMEAIEVMTSQTRIITHLKDDGSMVNIEVPIWNPTLANLSLMALGSSAPEIFLSLLEALFSLGENAGELGPSTIVGSAAFNLLVISAFSIVAVNDRPKGKAIDDVGVFATTSIWSIFAYVWLFICISVMTPHQVTILEAWLTFGFFFVLLAMAYGMDRVNDARKTRETQDQEAAEALDNNNKTLLRAKSRALEQRSKTGEKGDDICIAIAQGLNNSLTAELTTVERTEICELFMKVLKIDDLKGVSAK